MSLAGLTLGVEFSMKVLPITLATAPEVIIKAPARLPLFLTKLRGSATFESPRIQYIQEQRGCASGSNHVTTLPVAMSSLFLQCSKKQFAARNGGSAGLAVRTSTTIEV